MRASRSPKWLQALSLTAAESNGGIFKGSVSSEDPLFDNLLLWVDANHNGISEQQELRSASKAFSDIGVSYLSTGNKDKWGNTFGYRGWAHARTAPGRNRTTTAEEDVERTVEIWDMYFQIER